MAERELVLPGLGQYALAYQLAQRPDQLALGQPRDRCEQVEWDPVAEHRGRLDQSLMARLQVLDLAPQRFGEAPRQRLVTELFQVAARHAAQELLEAERITAGAVVERDCGPVRRRTPGGRGEEGRRLRE